MASVIRKPIWSGIAAIAIGILLSYFSIHWALAPLCFWVVLVAYRIEWSLLQRLTIPPAVILALMPALGMGLGVPLWVDSEEVDFIPSAFVMQLVFVLGAPILLAGYRLGRGRLPLHWCPRQTDGIFDKMSSALVPIGMFFLIFDMIRLVVGWRTGSLDRGYAGEVVLNQEVGISTFAALFNRWSNLWFFFLPVLWKKANGISRMLLAGVLTFYFLLAYASGSRGLLLYPVIFVICGIYFFIDKPHFKPEKWMPILLVFACVYIYAIDVFRNTEMFRESRFTDLSSRLAASKNIVSAARERDDFWFTTSRALIGVSDSYVYDLTPEVVPYAGAGDIVPAIMWTWVPHTIKRDKPTLMDSNDVVVGYTNVRHERSFNAISLSADLYRRFGWLAVPPGLFVMGVFFGGVVRICMVIFVRHSLVLGILFLVLIQGGVQLGLSSTLLQTWWIWAYDLPKHVLPLIALVVLAGGGVGNGMQAYLSPLGLKGRRSG